MVGERTVRVVFMGTSEFAVSSLEALAGRHDVVAVYTAPDRPAGRGRRLRASPVKERAGVLGIEVRQPQTLRDATEVGHLTEAAPDIICVASYGLILPKAVLEIPRLGCVNVHASLLPEYRGAAPVHRAILDGKAETGVSIMLMDEGLDTGPFAAQVAVSIGSETVGELTRSLAGIGAAALLGVIERMLGDGVIWHAQDESRASYASKIGREDVLLDPRLGVEDARRRVRISTRSAPATLSIGGRALCVVEVADSDATLGPGRVAVVAGRLVAGFADGALILDRVRPAGGRTMAGAAFARGLRAHDASRWESAR